MGDSRREDAGIGACLEPRHDFYWAAARRKFKLEGDDVYDDDDATMFVEMQMCAEALGSWRKRAAAGHDVSSWERGKVFKRLDEERTIGLAAVSEAARLEQKAEGSEALRYRGRNRTRARAKSRARS